jgi:site-specific DNA recombinase
MDVEDVAAGHETKQRWNDKTEWSWSTEQTHEPLVSREDFAAVQAQMLASVHRPTPSKGHTASRHYVLSGRVFCALCERRMQGTWAHDAARYRCSYSKKVDHPKSVYLREDAILPKLDAWLTGLFDEAHLDSSCEALAMAGQVDDGAEARAEAARRAIADCDDRLAKYRKALDAGADAVVVASWMAEVHGERLRAEAALGTTVPAEQMTKSQIREMGLALRDLTAPLAKADPKLRAEVYAELGVNVVYDHERRVVSVTAGPSPCTTGCVGEGT